MRIIHLSAALLIVGIALGCGSRHNPAPVTNNDPRCSTVTTDIESVWSDEIELSLSAHVSAAGEEVGSAEGGAGWTRASLNRITTGMDQASQDWARIRSQNCNDVENERMTQETYEARMGCLDQWLANTRSAVTSEQVEAFDTAISTLNECFTASR